MKPYSKTLRLIVLSTGTILSSTLAVQAVTYDYNVADLKFGVSAGLNTNALWLRTGGRSRSQLHSVRSDWSAYSPAPPQVNLIG